jgi:outer membrane protein
MTRFHSGVLALLLGLSASGPAIAADLGMRKGIAPLPPLEKPFQRFYIHAGPVGLFYSESAKMAAGGARIPGADVRIPNSLSFAVEAGYFFSPNFAVGFAGGYPPLVKVEAKGSINGLGTLGKVAGGPTALTAQYHFTGLGAFQPYVGLGPSLMVIFNDKDGAVRQLKTDHALGFAVQAGFNYMLNDNWGVFVDAKKVFLEARTRGTLGGAPIDATVKLDPLVVHTGVTYRF